MFECVNLNKKNISEFQKLNEIRQNFNDLNEDFFAYYSKCSFAGQSMMRRKVKLLKNDNSYSGFIWIENSRGIYKIKSLFSENKTELEAYEALLSEHLKCNKFTYSCKSNDYNFKILEKLGFCRVDGEIEFCLSDRDFAKAISKNVEMPKDNLEIKPFIPGKDENLRCRIQNEIFDNAERVPLCIEDIIYDISRSHYVQNGSFFLFKGSECIGYGQIIISDGFPYIVNFGIIEDFRGHGYSKVLLAHLLKKIREKGYRSARLTVKSGNITAMNLYEGFGFKRISETYNWELVRSSHDDI